MPNLSALLPSSLARQARWVKLGASGVPALLIHPDWSTPAPTMLWMHGRTVNKELDPGRYLRWMRAEPHGIATVALDLPGHGERLIEGWEKPGRTLDVIEQMVSEIDGVLEALDAAYGGLFDAGKTGIGGMSAGGIVALRRLCDPHRFVCAAVESTVGNVEFFFQREAVYPPEQIARLDPLRRLSGAGTVAERWRPIPLLALHSRADRVAPIAGIESFVSRLRAHYIDRGVDPGLIEFVTWDQTGAPDEHNGFGRVAAEAKSTQVAFLTRYLLSR